MQQYNVLHPIGLDDYGLPLYTVMNIHLQSVLDGTTDMTQSTALRSRFVNPEGMLNLLHHSQHPPTECAGWTD